MTQRDFGSVVVKNKNKKNSVTQYEEFRLERERSEQNIIFKVFINKIFFFF